MNKGPKSSNYGSRRNSLIAGVANSQQAIIKEDKSLTPKEWSTSDAQAKARSYNKKSNSNKNSKARKNKHAKCRPQTIPLNKSQSSVTDVSLESESTFSDNSKQIIDKIFDVYSSKNKRKNKINITGFVRHLVENGLQKDDIRLSQMFTTLYKMQREALESDEPHPLEFSREKFHTIVGSSIEMIKKVFTKSLVIRDFPDFTQDLTDLFDKCQLRQDGKISKYLPQFSKYVNRSGDCNWAMSVCTIDGQRFNLGDYQKEFIMQGLINPFIYAKVLNEHSVRLLLG